MSDREFHILQSAKLRDLLNQYGSGLLKGPALVAWYDQLYDELRKQSNLPGVRENQPLAAAFGVHLATIGAAGVGGAASAERKRARGTSKGAGSLAFALAEHLVRLDAERAPGGTPSEFLPVCGVRALGALLARESEPHASTLLPLLLESADDFRFRVRQTVPLALADAFADRGALLLRVESAWLEGFFQASVYLRTLSDPLLAGMLRDVDDNGVPVAERVAAAFEKSLGLLQDAPRSAMRYPGYKELEETLVLTVKVLSAKLGAPLFEALNQYAKARDPRTRTLVEQLLSAIATHGRTKGEHARVRATLSASEPPLRDPTVYVGKTRNRSKRRERTS
jgi:hypothetical protein